MEDDLEHIGSPVIIVDHETNKILLGERMNSYKSGYFGLPGGRTEIKETVKNGVIREVEEETGLQVNNIECIGVVRELQDNYNFIHFGMLAKSFSGTLENREPHKCKEWKWYSLNNLPEPILPGHKVIIDMYKRVIKEKMLDIGHE